MIKTPHGKTRVVCRYAGHGFKYGGSSGQINMMQMKAKQAKKLEEEAALDEVFCYPRLIWFWA
jgi:hypothetical protein